MRKRLYAAYGNHLGTEEMTDMCQMAKPMGVGCLHDYKLVFQGDEYNGLASVVYSSGDMVPVVVWEITAVDERIIDAYEGVAAGRSTKEFVPVEIDGVMHRVAIHIPAPRDFEPPSDEHLSTIARGYMDFGLPVIHLNEAVIHANNNIRILEYAQ